MDPARRREIELTGSQIGPEDYAKLRSDLMAAMEEFAGAYIAMVERVVDTYKRDTTDLLAEIDRQQAEIKRLELALDVRRCARSGEIG